MKYAYMIVVLIAIALAVIFGWVCNLISLFDCDFKAPYKAEAIRTVGVFVPPVGAVAGYIDIED